MNMKNYTREDILNLVEEEDVGFIRLQFTDIFGTMKNVAITVSQLKRALDNKCMFDGSSIEGFARIEESDMYLHPDLNTFEIFPWRPQQGKVARFICDIYRPDGTAYESDPRHVLKKVLSETKEMGYDFNVGPECEFFLFETDDAGNPTTISNERAGYFDLGPLDQGENARRDIVLTMEDMGYGVEASHHEMAPAQHEIDLEYAEALDAADNIIAFLRRGADETLLFVCNFAPQLHEKLAVGVPFKGKYKEIFNSDAEKFGGSGKVNPRMKSSKAEECDGKENSITIQLAPLGISVFSCTPTEPEKKEKPVKVKKTTHSTKSVKEKAEKPAEKPAKRNAPAKKAEADLQGMMAEAAAAFNGKAGERAAAAAERLAGISDKLAEAKAGLSSKIISLSSIARRQAGLEEGLDEKVGKE